LEGGCGFGRYCFWLEKKGVKTTGIDIVKSAIKTGKIYAKKKGYESKLYIGNICRLPFKNNCFNGYISLGVVEHFENVKDIESVFKEAYRVLKHGGYAYFSIPNPYAIHMLPEKILKLFHINMGITHYLLTKNDILIFSRKVGFNIIDSGYHDFYFPIYSLIKMIVRRDIWLLKTIMMYLLNFFDNFSITSRFGSGIHLVVQKPYENKD